jgi:hypothetical protein
MASETLTPQPVSAVLLMNYGTLFILATLRENQPYAQNSDKLFSIGLSP